MFVADYFSAEFFTPEYFPQGAEGPLVKPPYFFHGYFPDDYFADAYFPGDSAPVTPAPEPEQPGVGGGIPYPSRARPPVLARGRLRLPARLRLRGAFAARPVEYVARADHDLLLDYAVGISLRSTASPADAAVVSGLLALPSLELEPLVVTMHAKPRTATPPVDEDEELLDFYLSQVKR
jgi:hypothetical protein